MITYKVEEKDGFSVLSFELADGVIDASQLENAIRIAPNLDCERGVVLSGRGPVWLFAALAHEYHTTRWCGTFDPRVGGGVVVSRHHESAPQIGEVVPV